MSDQETPPRPEFSFAVNRTIGDVFAQVQWLTGHGTDDEIEQFKADYVESIRTSEDFDPKDDPEQIMRSNVGYLSGYCGRDESLRIRARFLVEHPIFGGGVPSAKEAFDAGVRHSSGKEADDVDSQ